MAHTVVVTGAGGLLGSYLLPLLSDAEEVHAVGRADPVDRAPNVRIVPVDLSKPLDRSGLPEKVDEVYYLAQSRRFREFPDGAEDVFQVNTAQALSMLEHARRAGARSFVYASTGGVYAPSGEALTESSALAPKLDFYPASKRALELLAQAFTPYLNVVILRYFFIYGRRQERSMLVPRLADSIQAGRTVNLQGQNGLTINPVHAADAAEATIAAARLGRSGTFNVAGPEVLSLRQICDAIGEKVGRRPIYELKPESNAPSLVADTTAMRSSLGAPTRRFADCVSDVF